MKRSYTVVAALLVLALFCGMLTFVGKLRKQDDTAAPGQTETVTKNEQDTPKEETPAEPAEKPNEDTTEEPADTPAEPDIPLYPPLAETDPDDPDISRGKENETAVPTSFDPEKPMVALTFDDGPHPTRTQEIVQALNDHNVHATFFVVGNRVPMFPEPFKAVVDGGHEIANHTYSHVSMKEVSADELVKSLQKASDAVVENGGEATKLYRPCNGTVVAEKASSIPYPFILWSLDTNDWKKSNTSDSIYQYVTENVTDGDIILMHDMYEKTAEAVPRILDWLQQNGYQVGSVSELFQTKGVEVQNGVKYFSVSNHG